MRKSHSHDNVVFIDEHTGWLDFAMDCLSRAGYTVRSAVSLPDCLKLMEAAQFHLIIVDFQKAGAEPQAFQKVAELQAERGHRVIVVFPTELTPRQAGPIFALGANDCVDKVYEDSQLLELVQNQLVSPSMGGIASRRITQNLVPKILVVEDDRDWRRRLMDYLSNESYVIFGAGDLQTAIQMTNSQLFNVIVLDLRLFEDGEGYEGMGFMESLRNQGQSPAVIIVSAYGTLQHLREGLPCLHHCRTSKSSLSIQTPTDTLFGSY